MNDSVATLQEEKSSAGYKGLLFLIFVIFIAPQAFIPALEPLHLAKVGAILAGLAYGFGLLSGKSPHPGLGYEDKLLLALVAVVLISIPFSRWPGGSVAFLMDQYSKTLVVFFLIANLLTSLKLTERFLWLLVLCSGFNAVMGVYHYKTGMFFDNTTNRVMGSYSSLTGNPNDLALSLNLAIPFMWYFVASSREKLKRRIGIFAIVVAIAAIIVTFSRGGFVTLMGLALWMFYLRSRQQGLVVMGMNLIAILAGILLLMAIAPSGYGDRVFSIFDSSKDETGSGTVRWNLMVGSATAMIQHPFGIGFHMNNLSLQEAGLGWAGVHNVYLEIGSELGFLGLILFVLLQVKLIGAMRGIRNSLHSEEHLVKLSTAIEASMIAFAVAAMFHPVAYHFYFYILAGLAIATKRLAQKVQQRAAFSMADSVSQFQHQVPPPIGMTS